MGKQELGSVDCSFMVFLMVTATFIGKNEHFYDAFFIWSYLIYCYGKSLVSLVFKNGFSDIWYIIGISRKRKRKSPCYSYGRRNAKNVAD